MRRIRKAAILGSGIMGTGIACHLANIGIEVWLLDILPPNLSENHQNDPAARNGVAEANLKKAISSSPAPLYDKSFAKHIKVGNFEDHLSVIADCDWVLEVVIERLDIKQSLLEKVDNLRKPGTLITSNTSGIPIHLMAAGRSEDFRKHFCGTHFFNPPRYLRLLEIIPTAETTEEVVSFFMNYGDYYLGKQTVRAKDTPAFIANRIGVYAMARIYQLAEELKLDAATIDKLTGPAIGRPKTGTFRLGDLVGLDTAAKVIQGLQDNCPNDEEIQSLQMPAFFKFLLDNHFYGNKSGQGFYKKTEEIDDKGKKIIHTLNLDIFEYELIKGQKLPSLGLARQITDLTKRLQAFSKAQDAGGVFFRKSMAALFSYAAARIPEIADEIYSIDDALKAGFGWELGPFEYWDAIGLEEGATLIEESRNSLPDWVKTMIQNGHSGFYRLENGIRQYYDIASQNYKAIPGAKDFIVLDHYRHHTPVFKNSEIVLHDIGDSVLCLEFQSYANAIGEGILRGIGESIDIAESGDWKGLVIGNNATNFTVGANLMLIANLAYEQEFEELNMAVKLFQQTSMRLRYSAIPVVMATQGYVFGGGCEFAMHTDAAICAAESYIGLVEVGVGLIPGGAGTKEFALRAADDFGPGDVQIPGLIERFKTIAMASVGRSAHEAFNLGYLKHEKDSVVVNGKRNIALAKEKVLQLSPNYTQPIQREDILVLGRQGLASLYVAANELKLGHFASEHDIKIAKKIAYVLCGGDLTGAQRVSEQYLLDLEREAFLSLCGEPKTLERIQHMLQYSKPLRN